MDTTTVVIALAVIVLIGLVLAVALGRRSRLHSLPEGARERYAASWRAIEARFVDAPQDAIREADQLVTSLARERGARDDRIARPREVAASGDGDSMTENMRRAMLEYRAAVEKLLGKDPRTLRGRREVS